MSEWQPIETARKDQKSILVWCPENKCQYMVTWDDDGWFVFGSFTKLTRLVTHWRELPSSPDVEPQLQQPLRWVENCKPDKPGIWAQLYDEGNAIHVEEWSVEDVTYHATPGTRCYLGPIPEILPPMKKVVERLWLERLSSSTQDGTVKTVFAENWIADGETIQPPADWIRTDRTREREI